MLRLYSTITSKRTISIMGKLFSEHSLASGISLEPIKNAYRSIFKEHRISIAVIDSLLNSREDKPETIIFIFRSRWAHYQKGDIIID